MTSRVIYTALFGGYDQLNALPHLQGINQAICFTDDPQLSAEGWEPRVVEPSDEPAVMNRKIKMLPHLYLPDFDESLYVDASILVKRNPIDLFQKYLQINWIALPAHPFRETIRDEAWECVVSGKLSTNIAALQLGAYAQQGYPLTRKGLTANGIILRRHNEEDCIHLMSDWWQEFERYPSRDQLSLQFALWKSSTDPTIIEDCPWCSTRYFELKKHEYERSFMHSWLMIKVKKVLRMLTFGISYKFQLNKILKTFESSKGVRQ